jgi:hypothetical protein
MRSKSGGVIIYEKTQRRTTTNGETKKTYSPQCQKRAKHRATKPTSDVFGVLVREEANF